MKAMLLFITIFSYLAMNNSLMAGTETKDAESYLKNSKTFFIENKGQIKDTKGNVREDIKYYIKGNGMDIYFRDGGISYVMYKKTELENGNVNSQTQRVDLEFGDENHKYKIVPYDENITKISMMKGDINVKNARTFSKLVYEDVSEGIDLVYYPTPQSIKYDFVVKPNADLSKLNIKYNGVNSLEKIDNTSFKISTELGDIVEEVPSTYQIIDNKKLEYTADILIKDNNLQFDVGDYDKNYELVIDPELYWSTYIGGGGLELVGRYPSSVYSPNLTAGVPSGYASGGIDVDDEDNVYIVGSTNSNNFPWDTGQGNTVTDWDIFIQKYEEDGTLVYSDYVGGSGHDFGLDLELDEDFDPIICGATNSSNIFTSGRAYTSGYDYYIYEHKAFPQAACYGGTDNDFARGLTLSRDLSGNTGIIVTVGETMSSNAYTYNAWDITLNGSSDVYVVALYSNFTTKWTRYLGGDGDEIGMDVAYNRYKLPENENINELVIIGATDSKTNFPFTVTYPYQNTLNRDLTINNVQDGFLMDVFVNNGRDRAGTLFGGKGTDFLTDIEYLDDDILLVSGYTESNQTTDLFPWIPIGAYKGYDFGGVSDKGDGFIATFGLSGNFVLIHDGYIGGKDQDIVTDIKFDDDNNMIYATGYTKSDNFDIHHEYETNMNRGGMTGNIDAFQAQYDYNYKNINSTYFGGGDDDYGLATTINSYKRPIIYGESYGTTKVFPGSSLLAIPIPELNQAQTTYGGGDNDAFLTTFYSEVDEENVRWSTFFGGDDVDSVYALSIDQHEYVYITGTTRSDTITESFPATLGLVSDSLKGIADIFVTKFNKYGKRLWTTYLGGSGDDAALDMDLLEAPHWDDVKIYLTGYTSSIDFHMQASSTGEQGYLENAYDSFIAKLSADGDDLEALSYLGGYSRNRAGDTLYRDEVGFGIDIDQSTGYIYTTGKINAVRGYLDSTDALDTWMDTTGGKWRLDGIYYDYIADNVVSYIVKWDSNLDIEWGRWMGKYGYGSDVKFNETTGKVAICGIGFNHILPDTLVNNGYIIQDDPASPHVVEHPYLLVFEDDGEPYFGTYLKGYSNELKDVAGSIEWDKTNNSLFYAGITENYDYDVAGWGTGVDDRDCFSFNDNDIIVIKLLKDNTTRFKSGTYHQIGECEEVTVNDLKFRDANLYIVGGTFEDTNIGFDPLPTYLVPSASKYNSTSYEEGYIINLNANTLDYNWGTYISNDVVTLGNISTTDIEFQLDGRFIITNNTNYTEMNDYNPSNAFQQNLAGLSDGWIARYEDEGDVFQGKVAPPKVEELVSQDLFRISPNPAKSSINILTDLDLSKVRFIRIVDITGKLVYNNNEFISSINIEELVTGTYYIQLLFDDNSIVNDVFIKQ